MPYMNDTDGALFEQLRPRLKAISCRIVGSEAEAEDIVQDCFLKWQGTAQAALVTPAAWLTTVVQHHSIDRLRQRARDTLAAHGATELLPAATPALPEDGLLRRAELGEALIRMLACLSPAERQALVLHEVFEYQHADIAAALGTNTVNARQYLARARRRLREIGKRADGTNTESNPEKNREKGAELQRRWREDKAATPASEKLCRELIRRFQAALNGVDMPAMLALLSEEQPMSVRTSPLTQLATGASANDACYHVMMAA